MNTPLITQAAQPSSPSSVSGGQSPPVFGLRLAMGLLGIFLAAVIAGLNNRVISLAFIDVRGALGLSLDDASWLSTAYLVGELIAMPFATWCAITFSLRRFHLVMMSLVLLFALILPLIHNLHVLLFLRVVQGLVSGALIPVLMMAALRFLPAPIKLHGLALYSMTATFAPNIALWFAGLWTDQWTDWRLVYWHIIPIGLSSLGLVAWGIPVMPMQLARLKTANWLGMVCAIFGLGLLAIVFDQGVRLNWFYSNLIVWAFSSGFTLIAFYLYSEWHHPSPFIKLQLLQRRNLALGFILFFLLLIVLFSATALPASYLGMIQGYRPLQIAPIGLIISLPQLMLAPIVTLLLYRKWVDARLLLALGISFIAYACFIGSQLESSWIWTQFIKAQILQALGQPMAIVSLLFLCTSVVQPMEGPYVSGFINTLRALGVLIGSSIINQFLTLRSHFHAEMILTHLGTSQSALLSPVDMGLLKNLIPQQAFILATADAYRLLGVLACFLLPLVWYLKYIPAPLRITPSLQG